MHPAPSIILFTVLSGFGFGALFFLGLGLNPAIGWDAFFLYALSAGCGAVGLAFSFFHLGHPERALKAFTQWRSSWLSREGWLATITLTLAAVHGGMIVFLGTANEVLGQVLSGFALLTIFATSMIYAQLKTVPRWNDISTPIIFLASAMVGGAFLVPGPYVIPALVVFAALQALIWWRGDSRFSARKHTIGTATGLGNHGTVSAFEPPHTGTNYLMNEMIHVVGRRNTMQIRVIGVIFAIVLPVLVLVFGSDQLFRYAALGLHLFGLLFIRWLFFAQAEHVVGLYYGKR